MKPNNSSRSPDTILGDRALASWEIVSVVSSIVIAEWMLASVAGSSKLIVLIPVLLAFALMFASHRVRSETFLDIGFRFDNFLRSLWLLLLPVAVAISLCLIIAWRLGLAIDFFRWHANRSLVTQIILGFAWALVQQYVLQGFLNRRAMAVVRPGWPSVLIVAAIFAFLHLPNLWLAAITFAAGAVWAAIYQRAPNIYALAVSHSLMTWFVVSTLPQSTLRHMRVGFGYFT